MGSVRMDIRDSRGNTIGYSENDDREVRYFGFTRGYIGRFDKASGWWFWISGPKSGNMGPRGDIGYSEVLIAEGKR